MGSAEPLELLRHHETGDTERNSSPASWFPDGVSGRVQCRAGDLVPGSVAHCDRDHWPVIH